MTREGESLNQKAVNLHMLEDVLDNCPNRCNCYALQTFLF